MHLWVGLPLAAVLVVLSATGTALVYRHEIDQRLDPALLRVEPTSLSVGLGTVVRQAQRAVPGGEPRLVRLPGQPDDPVQVYLDGDQIAYLAPASGAVLGVRGTGEGAMNTVFDLHSTLLSGDTGERVVGVVGLLALVAVGSGLVLWWPSAPTWRRVWKASTVAVARGPRRLNYDVHRAGGLYTVPFLVVVAASGVALVFTAEVGAVLAAATRSVPRPSAPVVEDGAALDPGVLDAALVAASRALPGARATFVTLPRSPGAPLAVRTRAPGEWHPNGRSYVYLHPTTGRVLRTDDARRAGAADRALFTAYPLHTGAYGGRGVRALYAALGLAPAVLSVTGVVIWFRRWRARNRRVRTRLAAGLRAAPPSARRSAPRATGGRR